MKISFTWLRKQFYLFLPVILIQASSFVFAQSNTGIDPVYGFDPLLYNGKVYYFYQPATGGTQYLLTDFDKAGSVTIRGVLYSDLTINYDLYNQQLILKYINKAGSSSLIIVSDAWLESFILGGSNFSLISDADTTRQIYQVIGNSEVKVLYHRKKELLLDSFKSGGMHYFSEPKYLKYVYLNHKMSSFNSNRSFLKVFEKEKQLLIKKYMHAQKVNVKKADAYTVERLINYCNSLYKL